MGKHLTQWCVLFAIISSVFAVYTPYTCDTTESERVELGSQLVTNMQARGYSLKTQGTFFFLSNTTGGFGNNPSSQYGVYALNPDNLTDITWRLEEGDAVVFLGCTSPATDYYSYRSYLMATIEPPVLFFASLGDSLNQYTMNNYTDTPPVPLWNKTIAVVTTADTNTNMHVFDSFAQAGFYGVNTDIVPSQLLTMGTTTKSDIFCMLVRVAKFADEEAGEVYKNATFPVYHFTRSQLSINNPFATPTLIPRGTGVTEFQYNDTVNEIVDNVISYYRAHGYGLIERDSLSPVMRGGEYINGFHCIADKINCDGDNQDALYLSLGSMYRLSDSDVHVLVGLNHNATGKAMYSNVGLYFPSITGGAKGVAAMDNSVYAGSANQWAPNLADVDKAYVVLIQRQCDADDAYCIDAAKAGATPDQEVTYVTRAYLETATKTGPSPSEILAPTFLAFKKL